MKYFHSFRWICVLYIIFCIFFTFCIKGRKKESLSPTDPSSFREVARFDLINSTFRKELIDQCLLNHRRLYENSSSVCETSKAENDEQNGSFNEVLKSLNSLRQQIIPYPNDYFYGRGIVLTVGVSQLKFARVNLKMIEFSGTRLPVQIWYSVGQVSHQMMMNLINETPKLNASICCFHTKQCRTRTEQWQLDATRVYVPHSRSFWKHFPYKPAAIISSSFTEVLFLDSDAYVSRDPEGLFFDPMYLEFGALFYPDAYRSRQNPLLWKLLNTSCTIDEYELDSATIVINKERVWNGIYLTKLVNDHHLSFYGRVTDGDKDTFRIAFRYMNVKYYIVTIPCATGGFDGKRFCGRTLCKTDSLAQHIYINHVHIFKYENIPYTRENLDYTRIALGDLNDNLFFIKHCRLSASVPTCFHIVNRTDPQWIDNQCYNGEIPREDIENRRYSINEPLLYDTSRKNRLLISKTDDLSPDFLDHLLKYLQ